MSNEPMYPLLENAVLGDVQPLWQAFEDFLLRTSSRRPTPNTLTTYRTALNHYLEFLQFRLTERQRQQGENTLVWEWLGGENRAIDEEQFLEWMGEVALATKRNRLSVVRRLYQALDEGKERPSTGRVTLRKAKNIEDTTRPFTTGEIRQLLNLADPEQRLIILLGSELGLHAQEMTALRISHFSTEYPKIIFISQLDKNRRNEQISNALLKALQPWFEIERQRQKTGNPQFGLLSGRTARYPEARLRALCELAGIENRGLHGLRLYAGAVHFSQTGSLASVRCFLGLTGVTSSKAYERAARYIHY